MTEPLVDSLGGGSSEGGVLDELSEPKEKEPSLRLAGRVHVRGLFRRVWRPRCLELFSDGTLRYYESDESEVKRQQDEPQERHLDPPEETEKQLNAIGEDMGGWEDLVTSESQHDCNIDSSFCKAEQRCESWGGSEHGKDRASAQQEYSREGANEAKLSTVADKPSSLTKRKCTTNTNESESIALPPSDRHSEENDDKLRRSDGPVHVEEVGRGRGTDGVDIPRHRIYGHRPKATMLILHARTIDATAIRDLHVGLPNGQFGFMFRGRPTRAHGDNAPQPAEIHVSTLGRSIETQPDASNPGRDAPVGGSSTIASTSNAVYEPKENEKDCAGKADGTNMRQTHVLHVDLSTCKPKIAHHRRPISHSFHQQYSASDLPPARDYLCAVSTAEEADAWVVALRWAATMARSQSALVVARGFGDEDPNIYFPKDEDAEDIRVIPTKQALQRSMIDACQHDVSADAIRPNGRESKFGNAGSESRNRKEGMTRGSSRTSVASSTVIITKVQTYRTMWREATPKCLFEVKTLLLQRRKCNGASSIIDGAEERMVLRSCDDLMKLIHDLMESARTKRGKRHLRSVRVLERANEQASDLYRKITPQLAPLQWLRSDSVISQFDEIIRTISRSTYWCNSPSLRAFLGCSIDRSTKNEDTLCSASSSSSSSSSSGVCVERRQLAPFESSPNEFVKDWLSSSSGGSNILIPRTSSAFVMKGVSLLGIFFLYQPITLWYGSISNIPVVLTPFTLFGVVAVAFLSGLVLGHRLQLRTHANDTVAHMPLPFTNDKNISTKPPEGNDIESDLSFDDASEPEPTRNGHYIVDQKSLLHYKEKRVVRNPLRYDEQGSNCWSSPDYKLFSVRSTTYLENRLKAPSAPAPFTCRGVEVWLSENPLRHIARHPSILDGKLGAEDTFLVNFLLPFGNLCSYFRVPDFDDLPLNVSKVWDKFLNGDQECRDARLKMLPIVISGPWIVQKAVGPGSSPARLGKVMPLQYYFHSPSTETKGVWEVDVLLSGSKIASAIFNVVKGHAKNLTIAFAFILEAKDQDELPETVLCAFALHNLDLELCQTLPPSHL